MNTPDTSTTIKKRVELRGIWKRFPGVIANQDVSLSLYAGEVHALLGENGAGKTTLMNILAGIYRQDAGDILLDGAEVDIRKPDDALEHGIGMVHQHFRLVDNFTVPENVHLGWKSTPWHATRHSLAERLEVIAGELGFKFDPLAEVWELSVGEQQRAEILRALVRGAEILILDEPTAVLAPNEVEDLFRVVRRLSNQGHTIVFISHKLNEVLQVSDRVTVLRDGKNVATRKTSECDLRSLANLMVGREVVLEKYSRQSSSGEVVLKVKDLSAISDRGLTAIRNIDLDISRGEILGIAGVSGNGQTELAEVLTGIRSLESGLIEVAGVDISDGTPRDFSRVGVGHIPEDRNAMGLFPFLSLVHNAILRKYLLPPIRNGINISSDASEDYAKELVTRGDVRTPSVGIPSTNLSGGNQQKLLAQREIDIASHLLIAVHPTRGLDVGATEDLREALIKHRNAGNAILLISEDLEEIMMMSDRIAVMYEGKIVGIFSHEEAERETLGMLMGGKAKGAA
jgi:simple sugar transport system ATP-binding protein